MQNILTDLLNADVENVVIDRLGDDISFCVAIDDNDKEAIVGIDRALEQFI